MKLLLLSLSLTMNALAGDSKSNHQQRADYLERKHFTAAALSKPYSRATFDRALRDFHNMRFGKSKTPLITPAIPCARVHTSIPVSLIPKAPTVPNLTPPKTPASPPERIPKSAPIPIPPPNKRRSNQENVMARVIYDTRFLIPYQKRASTPASL